MKQEFEMLQSEIDRLQQIEKAMTTEEGNKMIAEFMECHKHTIWIGGLEVCRYGFKDTHITELWHETEFEERTPYHTDLNWLHPVVVKLSTHKDSKVYFRHDAGVPRIQDDISVWYEWVCKVIQWINQNKTT